MVRAVGSKQPEPNPHLKNEANKVKHMGHFADLSKTTKATPHKYTHGLQGESNKRFAALFNSKVKPIS